MSEYLYPHKATAAGESKDSPACHKPTFAPRCPVSSAERPSFRSSANYQPQRHMNTRIKPSKHVEKRQNKGWIPLGNPPFVFQRVVYSKALHCSDPEIPIVEAGKKGACCFVAAAAAGESSLPSASTSCTMV